MSAAWRSIVERLVPRTLWSAGRSWPRSTPIFLSQWTILHRGCTEAMQSFECSWPCLPLAPERHAARSAQGAGTEAIAVGRRTSSRGGGKSTAGGRCRGRAAMRRTRERRAEAEAAADTAQNKTIVAQNTSEGIENLQWRSPNGQA
jgi:hypothetical protein